jgi:hypothetical protein
MMRVKSLLLKSFFEVPGGGFALGRILAPAAFKGDFKRDLAEAGVGHWHCDLTNGDALTWSEAVYEIFRLPRGVRVAREAAVARYRDHSRSVLERLRSFAIGRKCGFILDAEIGAPHEDSRWIRILAAPIIEEDKVIGLHGLKRLL